MRIRVGIVLVLIAVLSLSSIGYGAETQRGIFDFQAQKMTYLNSGADLLVEGYLFNATNSDITGIYFVELVVVDSMGKEIGKGTFKSSEYSGITLASGKTKSISFTVTNPIKNKSLTTAKVQSNIGYTYKNVTSLKSDIKVSYRNALITYDVLPRIEKGRTLIPARYTFEKMGCKVEWRQSDQTVLVTKGSTSIEIAINSDIMLVNGKKITLEVPAQVIDNRTLVPLRAISEAMGSFVMYGSEFRYISIE